MAKEKKKKVNYVDKAEFFARYVEYADRREKAVAEGKPKPPIPEYLGECVLKICNHLSHMPNFRNYIFREEMVSDAIENIFTYFDNFDPFKSNQIFSYFTQIAYFAFLRRIEREKKYLYVKHKVIENSGLFDQLNSEVETGSAGTKPDQVNHDYMDNFVRDYEAKMGRDKAKKGPKVSLGLMENESV